MECTQALLNAGACPNVKDGYDNTPLILACETGSAEMAGLLVEKGAVVDLRNGGRGTALHAAAKWGYPQLVKLLLDAGADPNLQDGLWRTPLMLAARHAHQVEDIISTLLRAGSSVNLVGGDRRTVFHYAAARGLDLEALVEAGGNPFVPDTEGNTPLHLAAAEGFVTTAQHLLRLGGDPNAANYLRRTPLHITASRGRKRCLAALVKYGGDINVCDQSGSSPICHAAYNGHVGTVVYLLKLNCVLNSHHWKDRSMKALNPLDLALQKRHFLVAKCLLIGGCKTAHLSDWLRDLPPIICSDEEHRGNIDWLKSTLHNPWTLAHACRQVTRRCLGNALPEGTWTLPVPRKLKEYILLQELNDETGGGSERSSLSRTPSPV